MPPQIPANFLRIFLARHGQTDWNAERRLQGSQDTPLNDLGREQAAAMCQALRGIPFQHVYTSAQQRSHQTAFPLLEQSDLPCTRLTELNEQGLGAFEGHYMDGREPQMAATYLRRLDDHDDDLDGGESVNQHFRRVIQGARRILQSHPTGLILVVAHGATNAALLRSLLGLTFAASRAQRTKNCEVRLVDVDRDGRGIGWKGWEQEPWDSHVLRPKSTT